MYAILSDLVAELRTVGLPISTTEQIDAAQALGVVDLLRRDEVRSALRTTLVKHAEHLPAFDIAFDVFFADRIEAQRPATLAAFADEELREMAVGVAVDGNRSFLKPIAAELVQRHGRIESGRRVAGVGYLANVLTAIRFADVVEDLDAAADSTGPLDTRLRQHRFRTAATLLRDVIVAEIRARLVRDRGAQELARLNRVVLPESVDFANASRRELDEISDLIGPLARMLAIRSRQRRTGRRRGPVDFRRTIRLSTSTAGVPVDVRYRPRRPPRPHLVVLADVSGSVATFSRFTLMLVSALQRELPNTRTFAFIDDVVEVTDVLGRRPDPAAAWSQISTDPALIWLDGRSDYGHVLAAFARQVLPQLSSRTSLLVLGDGRSNFQDSGAWALAQVSRRIGQLVWLNPEGRHNWDTGDSVMAAYAPHCTAVHECRNLVQLRQFVERLAGFSVSPTSVGRHASTGA